MAKPRRSWAYDEFEALELDGRPHGNGDRDLSTLLEVSLIGLCGVEG